MIQNILYPVAIGLLFAEFSGIPQQISRWLLKRFEIGKTIRTRKTYPKHPDDQSEDVIEWEDNKIPARLKPFDCGMCLSFWIAVIQNYCLHYTVYDIFALAAASGCTAYLIATIHARINR